MTRHTFKIGHDEDDEDNLMDFAHSHRPKAMRRDLPGERAARNADRLSFAVNGVTDAEARAMVPPSMKGR